jgi:phenylacetic acid degradation operon negative regulatory protein
VAPTPKQLILDLLSSTRGRAVPVQALVAAGELFGIRSESVRVALTRLTERGTIARDGRARYRIAPAGEPVQRHVVRWTHLGERVTAWRAGWLGVHAGGLSRGQRSARRRRERALAFLGFRALEPGLYVRPDNLAGGATAVRDELRELGLEPAALVFAIRELDPASHARACGLWDAERLRRDYRDTRAALERSAARLQRLPAERAMVESFELGGRAIRQLARDPLLPDEIVPGAERAALVSAMRAYDRSGRACWRDFMQRHGAPHLDRPRSAVETGWPARAAGG